MLCQRHARHLTAQTPDACYLRHTFPRTCQSHHVSSHVRLLPTQQCEVQVQDRNGTRRDKILLLTLTLTPWEFWCHSSHLPIQSNNHRSSLYTAFHRRPLSTTCVSAEYKAGAVILAVRHQISQWIAFQGIPLSAPAIHFPLRCRLR